MALSPRMKDIVRKHSVGFVATVNSDGTPNLSPKGTMVVLDDVHIMFGEIRSPSTLRNIDARPHVEINFLDIHTRKGFRARGTAIVVRRSDVEFAKLISHFDEWGELAKRIRNIVKLRVASASVVTTPAYDIGETEESLRARWKVHYSSLE